ICEILSSTHFCFDLSQMGSGKTVIHLKFSKDQKIRIIVICTLSAQSAWLNESEKYGIEIFFIISYPSLTSRKGYQPKHGYLTRIDKVSGHPEFIPTDKLKSLIDEGVYVVFDECQSVKNKNQQHYACTAIVNCILRSKTGK